VSCTAKESAMSTRFTGSTVPRSLEGTEVRSDQAAQLHRGTVLLALGILVAPSLFRGTAGGSYPTGRVP